MNLHVAARLRIRCSYRLDSAKRSRAARPPPRQRMAYALSMPRTKCTRDLEALMDLCNTHALGIVRYEPKSEAEETVRTHRNCLVDLARLTPRVPAPLLAKTAKGPAPELRPTEGEGWSVAMN